MNKIALLFSGGVDSSVSLSILKEQNNNITAFYLKIWLEDELSYLGNCPWNEDLEYVKNECIQLAKSISKHSKLITRLKNIDTVLGK